MSQIFLDTNILLRFLTGEPQAQYEQARELMAAIEEGKTEGILSLLVLNELVWILEHYYKIPRDTYLPQLIQLLAFKSIKLHETRKDIFSEVISRMQHQKNLDVTDAYLMTVAKDIPVASFDKHIRRKS